MLRRVTRISVVAILCGCSSADQPQPPNGKKKEPDKGQPAKRPFMEHPSGEFKTAVDAMTNAIERLRALPKWDSWITFSAQGMGDRPDSYRSAEIQMRQAEIKLRKPVDVDIEAVTKMAGVPQTCLTGKKGMYTISNATPRQAALILNALFRRHLGIRPHPDQGDDYGVAAEW